MMSNSPPPSPPPNPKGASRTTLWRRRKRKKAKLTCQKSACVVHSKPSAGSVVTTAEIDLSACQHDVSFERAADNKTGQSPVLQLLHNERGMLAESSFEMSTSSSNEDETTICITHPDGMDSFSSSVVGSTSGETAFGIHEPSLSISCAIAQSESVPSTSHCHPCASCLHTKGERSLLELSHDDPGEMSLPFSINNELAQETCENSYDFMKNEASSLNISNISQEDLDIGTSSEDDGCADDNFVLHYLEEEPRRPRPEPGLNQPEVPNYHPEDPFDDPDDPEDDDVPQDSDDDDDDDDDDGETISFDDAAMNTQLQFGHQGCTLREALLLNLATSVKHRSTYEALVDSLAAWSTGLGRGGVMPTTKKRLWKLIKKTEAGLVKYAYCPTCLKYHGKHLALVGPIIRCECGTQTAKKMMPFFVSLSLKKQLEQFLALPGIVDILRYRETRRKQNENAMEDIFDGELYRNLVANGTITMNDYTYTFNSDGFRLFKRKSLGVWGVLARLNEPPPNIRQRYCFLIAVWIDKVEPRMNTFLKPFVTQANRLSTEGIVWRPDGHAEVRSRFKPIGCCVDAVARAMIMNQNQYNGAYGCYVCTHQGVYLGGSMKYPQLPFEDLPPAELRTHDSIVAAMMRNELYKGQKGPSEVMLLRHFDMGKGNGMDDLHPFYEGVSAFYLELLINSLADAVQPRTLAVINMRMQTVRTPVQMARKWLSILKRTSWKGSQWGYFIRYFIVICFYENNLPQHHLQHLSMLSYVLFVFSQDSIDPEDFQRASEYADRFVELFQEYYQAENMRFNVHMLTHLAESRRQWSASWTVSTFNFESWNGSLGDWVTSPKGAINQIVFRHFLKLYVNSAVHRNDISERVKDHLSDSLFATQRKIAVQVDNETVALGKGIARLPSPEEQELLRRERILCRNVTEYDRILVRGIEFRCRSYHEETRSNNSVAFTWEKDFVTIEKIIVLQHNEQRVSGLFVTKHAVEYPFRFAHHIGRVLRSQSAFMKANLLRIPAIQMDVHESNFLVPMANCREID